MNAALLMAKTSSLLRCLAKTGLGAGELLSQVNNELCETASRGMFVTVVSGFVDPSRQQISLSNGGHQPPLLHHRDGEFEEIPANAPPLGIITDIEYPEINLELNGGKLYLFTDGVAEGSAGDHRRSDIEGLKSFIEHDSAVTLQQKLEGIVAEIRTADSPQHDDMTLMLIECQET